MRYTYYISTRMYDFKTILLFAHILCELYSLYGRSDMQFYVGFKKSACRIKSIWGAGREMDGCTGAGDR